jgi:very-short-patch-repair endonuclease
VAGERATLGFMELLACIRSLGGVAPTYRLLRMGWTGRALKAAVHRGAIVRVRQGWYASAFESADNLAAWRVGGRLTCVSGAAFFGLATRSTDAIHVAVARTASRLRKPSDMRHRLTPESGAVVHWRTRRIGSAFVESPLTCLIDMCRCESPEFVVAAVDSALHAGLISRAAWLRAVADLPLRLRLQLADVDGRSESIIESISRFRCRALGLQVRIQVTLASGVRVDMVIGDRLVVEVDGREYHSNPAAFERDRIRDARLTALGYRVLHFSYKQVMYDWPSVEAAILAAVEHGDHRLHA